VEPVPWQPGPYFKIRGSALSEIRAEAKRTALFCVPDAPRVEVDGV